VQIAEITRQETSQRADLLRVHSYDVHLDLARDDKIFRSVSVVTFDCTEPGASSYADLVAETVHEITLNGCPVDPDTAWAQGRITLSGLAAHNELRVVADCAYRGDTAGLSRTVDSADGRIYTFTQFEPADARRVYANFEQPDLKAAFTFHVTAPEHWVVLSNQPAPAPEPAGDGTAVWHFPPTPRISTYLTAIVAGEYHLVREPHTTPSGQSIPLGLACRQSLAGYLEPDDVFTVTRQGLDFFTRLFGTDFPFAKYDQVYVADHVGAMENVGCVTITEGLLFRSKVTDLAYQQRAVVILHEMAHQWFGDLVTMKWWEDLWLNESFAEFSAFYSAAAATRFTEAWTTFCAARKLWGYMQDQQPSTHPVAADAKTLSEASANADGISYAKGASVLKQLAAALGEDNFFAGLRAYFAEHGWGNATAADLLRAFSASSGRNLADWSKEWLETAGPNTLRPEFELAADGTFTQFAVLQEAPAAHPTLRRHHIAIGLYNLTAGGSGGHPPGQHSDALVRTHQVEVDVAGPRTQVPGLVGLARPDLILLNDDDLGYALVRFDQGSLATLTESIGAFSDPLARTICWSAVLDMALQAELSLPAFVRILAAGMRHEPSVSVLQVLHSVTEVLVRRSADPARVREIKQQLAGPAVELLTVAEPGSDRQLVWAQLLHWTATSAAQLDLITALLDGRTEIPGLVVDTDLRWRLLSRLVETERAGDAEIDAELARDNTDAGRRYAQACRAAVPDAEHKAAAWRLVAESSELSYEGAVRVAMGFNQPEHAHLLAPYAEKYFDQLPGIWEVRTELVRVLFGGTLFPYTQASPELLARVDEFLSRPDLDPSLRRVVVEGRDQVEKTLRSRALPG
jgi:aminopeptidase N